MITRLVVHWILKILFWKGLQINCSWYRQTKSFRCWFKSNSTSYFYWQNKINSRKYKSNNLLHSWTIKKNNTRICKKNDKSKCKITDTQLKKLKNALKDKTGTTLRMSLKMLDWNYLPHELLLTTRQKTRLKNAFNNKMSTDLKLCKAQISKII